MVTFGTYECSFQYIGSILAMLSPCIEKFAQKMGFLALADFWRGQREINVQVYKAVKVLII